MPETSLWNNIRLRLAIIAVLMCSAVGLLNAASVSDYKLLLTPQRLKRLQRDHERQTVRWVNFENRVESVPDSPERGFELALYYAVTGDEKRGREAVAWALAHPCDQRQVALILDWCGPLFDTEQRQLVTGVRCDVMRWSADHVRNRLFMQIVQGKEANSDSWKNLLQWLQAGNFENGSALYATCEYLAVMRSSQHADLREDARQFFANLPIEFLLSLKPAQVEHPDWMIHIAALALVGLDPNLEASQYLQGWVMEDQQMIREGPGVAYEFLWADPYLPGVGYENLNPWIYDEAGRLFARKNWNGDSCWIGISPHGVEQQNCAAGWEKLPAVFGSLTLVPMSEPCIPVPVPKPGEMTILWNFAPHAGIVYSEKSHHASVEADPAGMWEVPNNAQGKVCTAH